MGTRKRLTAVRAAEGGREWRRLVTVRICIFKAQGHRQECGEGGGAGPIGRGRGENRGHL